MINPGYAFLLVALTVLALSAGAATLVPTPSQTAGPYYKAESPARTSLIDEGTPGTKLLLTGRVLTTAGAPVKGAWLDFWQADANGRYDNKGFRLRGHQYTDDEGRYSLETVVPSSYFGRTPHLHVKVAAPNGRPLTTQLYFPDAARNRDDFLFDPALLVQLRDERDRKHAAFDFVLDLTR